MRKKEVDNQETKQSVGARREAGVTQCKVTFLNNKVMHRRVTYLQLVQYYTSLMGRELTKRSFGARYDVFFSL